MARSVWKKLTKTVKTTVNSVSLYDNMCLSIEVCVCQAGLSGQFQQHVSSVAVWHQFLWALLFIYELQGWT